MADERPDRTVDKTKRGGLPAPFTTKAWVGPGSVQPCSGCDDMINRAETEYEIELWQTVIFRFHVECYRAWLSCPVLR
jgi:hypothetical protein